MVYFQSVGHVSHSASIVLEFVGHETYFMASFNQALGKLISMRFDSSEFREREVSADEYAILFGALCFIDLHLIILWFFFEVVESIILT